MAVFQHNAFGVGWRLVLAPVPSLLVIYGRDLWSHLGGSAGSLQQRLAQIAPAFPTLAIVAALVALVLGTPLYLLYRRFHWSAPWAFAVGAAAIPSLFYIAPELWLSGAQRSWFSVAGCDVIVDGVRTACGWRVFGSGLAWNAAFIAR